MDCELTCATSDTLEIARIMNPDIRATLFLCVCVISSTSNVLVVENGSRFKITLN